jgi:hypothetical protein
MLIEIHNNTDHLELVYQNSTGTFISEYFTNATSLGEFVFKLVDYNEGV